MNWYSVKIKPGSKRRIVVYAPDLDETMQFRIIESDFLNTVRDATHWAYLEKPKEVSGFEVKKKIEQYTRLKLI